MSASEIKAERIRQLESALSVAESQRDALEAENKEMISRLNYLDTQFKESEKQVELLEKKIDHFKAVNDKLTVTVNSLRLKNTKMAEGIADLCMKVMID